MESHLREIFWEIVAGVLLVASITLIDQTI
jgi:hypothetical protein